MSFEKREVKVTVCDGCDYDIGKHERYITLDFTYSFNEGHHGKIPLHFHELSHDHDCLRYFFTGFGVMDRVLKKHQMPNGLLPKDHVEFILDNLRAVKVTT